MMLKRQMLVFFFLLQFSQTVVCITAAFQSAKFTGILEWL
jgi:hypothetical protein